jgi:hypothetical protein
MHCSFLVEEIRHAQAGYVEIRMGAAFTARAMTDRTDPKSTATRLGCPGTKSNQLSSNTTKYRMFLLTRRGRIGGRVWAMRCSLSVMD